MSNRKEESVNTDSALTTHEPSGFFGELWKQVQLVYKLLLDPEVPIYLKVLPFAAIIYLLFPFDFLPDVIPGIGQLDDITLLVLGAKMFIELAPDQAVARHLQAMRQEESYSTQIDGYSADEETSEDVDIIDGIIIEDDLSED